MENFLLFKWQISWPARYSQELFECFLVLPHLWNIWLRWSQGKAALEHGLVLWCGGCPRFWPTEESDLSRSGMSGRAQASVLRDADEYIINMPSAALLEFNVASQSRQCFPLSIGLKIPAPLQRWLSTYQDIRWYPTASAIACRSIYSTFIQRIPELHL